MTYTEAVAKLQAHKETCRFRATPGDRRSGSGVCGTCWALTQEVVAAEAREAS